MVMNIIALESAPIRILTLSEPSSTDSPLAPAATAITREMKVRSGRVARIAEQANDIADFHPIAQLDAKAAAPRKLVAGRPHLGGERTSSGSNWP